MKQTHVLERVNGHLSGVGNGLLNCGGQRWWQYMWAHSGTAGPRTQSRRPGMVARKLVGLKALARMSLRGLARVVSQACQGHAAGSIARSGTHYTSRNLPCVSAVPQVISNVMSASQPSQPSISFPSLQIDIQACGITAASASLGLGSIPFSLARSFASSARLLSTSCEEGEHVRCTMMCAWRCAHAVGGVHACMVALAATPACLLLHAKSRPPCFACHTSALVFLSASCTPYHAQYASMLVCTRTHT